MSAPSPILEARGVRKRFGGLVALDGVDFALRAGEVHALVGENGAGKTTLASILYGLVDPDEGSVYVDGRPVRFERCADAMRAGVGMVFQHFLLVERFTVAENVLLGREPSRHRILNKPAAAAAVAAAARRFDFALDPGAAVESLGVGARQQVELLKVLERDAASIILDEPTAALSPMEARTLLDVIRRLRAQGKAVALIAHKLKEVLDVADRITVLRAGKVVGSVAAARADVSTLAQMMVGRSVDVDARVPRATSLGDPSLIVDGLEAARDDGAEAVRGVSLAVRSREIVGVAGVEGNGQVEFAEALYGLRPALQGTISLLGRDITHAKVATRRALGMRYVPADRLREGLVLDFDAAENAILGDQRRRKSLLIDAKFADARARAIAAEYALAGFEGRSAVRAWSGGTQQKLIVGRELAQDAAVVIAVAPTRGVDVGAAEIIRTRLRTVRDAGAAIVLVSYDLDELRALSDRIVVFSQGAIAGEVSPDRADDATLGRLMAGVSAHA